jgi:hypothetical protein
MREVVKLGLEAAFLKKEEEAIADRRRFRCGHDIPPDRRQ